MHESDGRLVAVNVVSEIRPDPEGAGDFTAIDKRPVPGLVRIGPLGVEGDQQLDTKHHGGCDQAVYAFAREDVVHWEEELGRPISAGMFGENLTTEGVEVSDAIIGERWRVGGDRADAVVVEVTLPRVPCATFASWMGERRWIKRFSEHGRTGAYLRVVETGRVQAGDRIELLSRPGHGVTVGSILLGTSKETAVVLRDAAASGEVELAAKLRRKIDSVLRR